MAPAESLNQPKTKKSVVKIREMTIDDLALVFHMGEKLFRAEHAPNTYRAWDEYEVTDLFYSDTEFCLVAEYEEQTIGFALGTTISKPRSAWKYGYLTWLGVLPGFQRKGIADKLFQRFKSLMLQANVRILVVDTEADNATALNFFAEQGFGHPQEHIYLSMNLDQERQRMNQKKKPNGSQQGFPKTP